MTIDDGPVKTQSGAMLRYAASLDKSGSLYPSEKLFEVEEAVSTVFVWYFSTHFDFLGNLHLLGVVSRFINIDPPFFQLELFFSHFLRSFTRSV